MNWSVYWHSGQYSTLVAPVYWSVYRVDTKVTRRGVVKLLEHLCIGLQLPTGSNGIMARGVAVVSQPLH